MQLQRFCKWDAPFFPTGDGCEHEHGDVVDVDLRRTHMGSEHPLPRSMVPGRQRAFVRLEFAAAFQAMDLLRWIPPHHERQPGGPDEGLLLMGFVIDFAMDIDRRNAREPLRGGMA